MNVLGISCFFHDSAAALVRDGQVVAAVQEERLSREKGAPYFPKRAINHCLQAGGLTIQDVDVAVFHEKPFLKFARVIQAHVRAWPGSFRQALATFPSWLEDRLIPGFVLERETGSACPTLFLKHHYSHGATAFLGSPFDEAAVLTADGVGEMATMTWGRGSGTTLAVAKELPFPHSLGLMYSAVTEYLGLAHHSGEDGVAAMAPRGHAEYLDRLRPLVTAHDDGSFRVDESWFEFTAGPHLYGTRFTRAFGPPRVAGAPLEQRHLDMAASVQALLEERMVAVARHVRQETGLDRLCLGGGIAHNAACCSRILEEAGFREIFVPPLPGNDGSALGAAMAIACSRGAQRPTALGAPCLGPSASLAHVRRTLTNSRLPFAEVGADEIPARGAALLQEHGVLAWFQGRLEFAHRALGTRAILLDPRHPQAVDRTSARLGLVEPRAGLGLLVQEERCPEWFDLATASPYQLLAPRAHEQARALLGGALREDGRVVVQTVSREAWPRLWNLLEEVGRLTGAPVLAILPLQREGEPLACTPEDALAICREAGVPRMMVENLVVDLPAVTPP